MRGGHGVTIIEPESADRRSDRPSSAATHSDMDGFRRPSVAISASTMMHFGSFEELTSKWTLLFHDRETEREFRLAHFEATRSLGSLSLVLMFFLALIVNLGRLATGEASGMELGVTVLFLLLPLLGVGLGMRSERPFVVRFYQPLLSYLALAYFSLPIYWPIIGILDEFDDDPGGICDEEEEALFILAVLGAVLFSGAFVVAFLRLQFIYAIPVLFVIHVMGLVTALVEFGFVLLTIRGFVGMLVFGVASYTTEVLYRKNFLHSMRLAQDNQRLMTKIRKIKRSNRREMRADFNSPLQAAFTELDTAINNDAVRQNPDLRRNIVQVHRILKENATALFAPNLRKQIREGKIEVDRETSKWLSSNYDAGDGADDDDGPSGQGMGDLALTTASEAGMNEAVPPSSVRIADPEAEAEADGVDPVITDKLKAFSDWTFDIFAFAQVCDSRPLVHVAMHCVQSLGLFDSLSIDRAAFRAYVTRIETGYLKHNAPFHHNLHAADVVHCIMYLLSLETVKPLFTDLEIFAAIFSAVVHDVEHPGRNNAFQVSQGSKLALRYNDQSVLENYHCSRAFEMLSEERSPFSAWTKKDWKRFRALVIKLVMATDMGSHFVLLGQIKTSLGSAHGPSRGDESHVMLLQGIMKVSDISNPLRPPAISQKWTRLVVTEFFEQGDAEKELGLDVSPFMDRHATSVPKSQVGFIEFVVEPLVMAFHEYLDIAQLVECMDANKAHWKTAGT